MKKTIFFDLGNVLLSVNKKKAIEYFSRLTNISATKINDSIDWNTEEAFEKGELTIPEYIKIVQKKLNLEDHFTEESAIKIWQDVFEKMEPVIDILYQVKSQTKIFLLSNTNALHIKAVRKKFNILDEFDGLALSYELKCRKPEPAIYKKALLMADAEPAESIFIDDLNENIIAAKKIGISALQYKSTPELIAFLANEGFSIK